MVFLVIKQHRQYSEYQIHKIYVIYVNIFVHRVQIVQDVIHVLLRESWQAMVYVFVRIIVIFKKLIKINVRIALMLVIVRLVKEREFV